MSTEGGIADSYQCRENDAWTITDEHGVGIGKQKYMNAGHGARALVVMRAIKQAIDPKNLINPGEMLPPS